MSAELLGNGAGEGCLLVAGVEGCGGFNKGEPGFLFGGGIVASSARDYEELAGQHRDGAAVCVGAADAEVATENEKHLIFVVMRMPGEFALDLRHFDVLVVDLTEDSG